MALTYGAHLVDRDKGEWRSEIVADLEWEAQLACFINFGVEVWFLNGMSREMLAPQTPPYLP